jgi:hypothetical protein
MGVTISKKPSQNTTGPWRFTRRKSEKDPEKHLDRHNCIQYTEL